MRPKPHPRIFAYLGPKSARDSRHGFTLIEIVIYIALVVTLSAIAVDTLLTLERFRAEIRVTRSLNSASSIAMGRMTRVIKNAKSVNAASSTFDSNPGTLVLSSADPTPLTQRFFLTGFTLTFDTGQGAIETLTPPEALVTSLIFRHITASSTSEAVKIELTLESSSGKASTTQIFYNTAVLRNSYSH